MSTSAGTAGSRSDKMRGAKARFMIGAASGAQLRRANANSSTDATALNASGMPDATSSDHNTSGSSSSSVLPELSHHPQAFRFSQLSTPAVPDSFYFSQDFRLGAGMVVFQPSTDKVLLIYDENYKYWLLPKGRKDRGESLEAAALREAYEETGYTVEFLPITTPTLAPRPPGASGSDLHTEPFHMSIQRVPPPSRSRNSANRGCEYFVYWYIGQIGPDDVRKEGTGMPDEQGYKSYLLTYEEALERLKEYPSEQIHILAVAWYAYKNRQEPWCAP